MDETQLRTLLHEVPEPAPRRDLAEDAWQQGRRSGRRRLALGVAGVVALAGAGAAVAGREPGTATTPATGTAAPSPSSSPSASPVLLAPAPEDEAGLRWAATVLPRRLDLTAPAPPLSQDAVRSALALFAPWTEDGSDPVLVLGDDGRLRTLDTVRLDPARDADGNMSALTSTALSPDGRWAAFLQPAGVVVVDLVDGSAQRFSLRGLPESVRWSPDGSSVLVAGASEAHLVHPGSGPPLALDGNPRDPFYSSSGQALALPPVAQTGRPRLQVLVAGRSVSEVPITAPVFEWFGAPWVAGDLLARDAFTTRVDAPGVGVENPEAVVVLDARSGRMVRLLVVSTTRSDGSDSRWKGCCQVLGWLDERTVLFTSWAGRSSRLLAWDVSSGQVRRVSELDSAAVVALRPSGLAGQG